MNRRLLTVLFSLFAATSCLLFSCTKPQGSVLAITHVTVIDMTGAPPLKDQTVLIDKQRITAIGGAKTIAVPGGAQSINGSGKFLIPGLADMHVHLTGAGEPGGSREFVLPLLFANGITTVRDMGGYLESLLLLRKEIAGGKRIGPQILLAGPYLDGSPPAFEPSLVVTNSVQASENVRTLMQRGVDFIKVQSHLGRDAYFAIAHVCQRERITFAGHVPDRVTAWEAADAGQKSIEHLTSVLRACSRDEAKLIREQFRVPAKKERPAEAKLHQIDWRLDLLNSFSETKEADLLAKFAARQTWQTPTLILLQNDAFVTLSTGAFPDPREKQIPRKILERWNRDFAPRLPLGTTEEAKLRGELMQKSLHIVGDMQKSGVKLLAGTDTAAPFVFPGSSLHEELGLVVEAGLTPMEALQAATRNPAEFLGKLDSQGTIEKGKFADLVLLDANPLEDIRNTQKIRAVILRGKVLDRATLDSMIAGVEEYAKKN